MARYTGPRVRVSRRIGFNVFENRKGDKALQDRPYPPGENGRKRVRETDYGTQLKEKQKVRYMYGVLEKQFRKTLKNTWNDSNACRHDSHQLYLYQLPFKKAKNTFYETFYLRFERRYFEDFKLNTALSCEHLLLQKRATLFLKKLKPNQLAKQIGFSIFQLQDQTIHYF